MNATDRRAHLRAIAEALPEGSAVPVPREWVLELAEPCGGETPPPVADRLLTAAEVAERLGLSLVAVYRQAKRWPFTRRLGRRMLRFSEAGLARWLDHRPRSAA